MEKREGYKKTPLGWIPEEWEIVKLGDILSKKPKYGANAPSTKFFPEKTYRYIRITDIDDNGKLLNEEIVGIYKSDGEEYILKENDILIARTGNTVGKSFLYNRSYGDCAFAGYLIRFEINQELYNIRFLFHILHSFLFWNWVKSMIRVGAQPNINSKEYQILNIPSPPLPEQKKIAAILSTVDEKIESIETEIDAAEGLKKGLMQQLLTRGIGHTDFKETAIGTIPKEWEVVLLDSVSKRGSGHTPNRKIKDYWHGGIKWVSLADTKNLDRLFINNTEYEISEEGIKNSSAVKHKKGTVIISRDAGVGKSSILNCEMAVSQHFMAWECSDKLNNVFLYYFLQSWKPKFEAIANGTTIKTIGLGYFKNFSIPLPPLIEQKKISSTLSTVDEKLDILREKKEACQLLKKGLMQQLLTGNIRVSTSPAA